MRLIGPGRLHGHQVPVVPGVGLVHRGGGNRVGGVALEEPGDLIAIVRIHRIGHEEVADP